MELFIRIQEELEVTREQAEGGVGSLLQLAQVRLEPDQFVRVADTIPGISDILGKAPRFEIPKRGQLRSRLSRLFGGLGGLAPLARPFSCLHLEKPMIRRFAAVLISCFAEKSGPEVEELLAGVWR
jgi:hypothetical protein